MSSLHFEVPGNVLRNSNAISSFIQCFVHHILYMRGLIPAPFRSLLADVQQVDRELEETGKKYSITQKKTKLFVAQTASMMQGIQSVLQSSCTSSFLLILGPSATNMKEFYSLEFHQNDSLEMCHEAVSSKALDRLQRQLLIKLVEYTSQVDYRPLPPTNVFCALNILKDVGLTDGSDNDLMLEIFVMREKLKLKTKLRGPKPLVVKISAPLPQTQVTALDSNLEYECCSSVAELTLDDLSCNVDSVVSQEQPVIREHWLVLKKGIKSLRTSV